MSTGTPPGLALQGVSHAFDGRPAVDGVSLAVDRGEVLCLLGPSGCGKSTLLRLAAGIEPLQAGRVDIGGREVADPRRTLPPERRDVGMVFQDYALFPHLTVLQNVAFGLRSGHRDARRARALELLESVELADRAGAYPHVLSGGEQQRVALARALAPGPAVMLLDEPFAGLDTRLRRRVREGALRLLHESGAAVLLVTHDPEEAMAMADRLAVMRAGRIEQVGPPGDVYARPATAFVAHFLGETNAFPGAVDGGAVLTPLGAVPAPGYPQGAAVQVLVRPEHLALETPRDGSCPGATVEGVRPIGAQTVITLRLDGPPDSALPDEPPAGVPTVSALRLGPVALAPGDRVGVRLDPGDALVFPLSV